MVINGIVIKDVKSPILISVCCVCNRLLDIKSTEGGSAGLSHGYCSNHLNQLLGTL